MHLMIDCVGIVADVSTRDHGNVGGEIKPNVVKIKTWPRFF